MKRRKIVLIAGSILAVVVCSGALAAWGVTSLLNNPSVKEGLQVAGGEYRAMVKLREQIYQTCDCRDVGVQLMNGDTLNISLINSEFSDQSMSEQADSAREMATFVKQNYTGQAKIVCIVIILVERANIGPVNTSRTFNYPFEVSELE